MLRLEKGSVAGIMWLLKLSCLWWGLMVQADELTSFPTMGTGPTMAPTLTLEYNITTAPSSMPSLAPSSVPSANLADRVSNIFAPTNETITAPPTAVQPTTTTAPFVRIQSSAPAPLVPTTNGTTITAAPVPSPSINPTAAPAAALLPGTAAPAAPAAPNATLLPPDNTTTAAPITPTAVPSSVAPTLAPLEMPSGLPSLAPSAVPSVVPSQFPSTGPSVVPSVVPIPSMGPSVVPSVLPSLVPAPSSQPSVVPSMDGPSAMPSLHPSSLPSTLPSLTASQVPSVLPSQGPSVLPSLVPSSLPSLVPSLLPSKLPSRMPSTVPSTMPSVVPTISSPPTMHPTSSTQHPTPAPTTSVAPSSSLRSTAAYVEMIVCTVPNRIMNNQESRVLEQGVLAVLEEVDGLFDTNVTVIEQALLRSSNACDDDDRMRRRSLQRQVPLQVNLWMTSVTAKYADSFESIVVSVLQDEEETLVEILQEDVVEDYFADVESFASLESLTVVEPTVSPTVMPTPLPSTDPTSLPTMTPSALPSLFPSALPTTAAPSTATPTAAPTTETARPTRSIKTLEADIIVSVCSVPDRIMNAQEVAVFENATEDFLRNVVSKFNPIVPTNVTVVEQTLGNFPCVNRRHLQSMLLPLSVRMWIAGESPEDENFGEFFIQLLGISGSELVRSLTEQEVPYFDFVTTVRGVESRQSTPTKPPASVDPAQTSDDDGGGNGRVPAIIAALVGFVALLVCVFAMFKFVILPRRQGRGYYSSNDDGAGITAGSVDKSDEFWATDYDHGGESVTFSRLAGESDNDSLLKTDTQSYTFSLDHGIGYSETLSGVSSPPTSKRRTRGGSNVPTAVVTGKDGHADFVYPTKSPSGEDQVEVDIEPPSYERNRGRDVPPSPGGATSSLFGDSESEGGGDFTTSLGSTLGGADDDDDDDTGVGDGENDEEQEEAELSKFSAAPPPPPPDEATSVQRGFEGDRVLRDCYAPPGKLGVVIDSTNKGPIVDELKVGSPLRSVLYPGDIIIAVDDEDTRKLTARQVTSVMASKAHARRKITVLSKHVE